MKKKPVLMVMVALLALASTSYAGFIPWAVGPTASTVVNGDGSISFSTPVQTDVAVWTSSQTGQKAFFSADDFNGLKVGDIVSVTYDLVSSNPSEPSTGLKGPYLNIVVTDGSGGHSYLLLDAAPVPLGQQSHVFSTSLFSFNETSPGTLATYVAGLTAVATFDGKSWYSFGDVKNLTIAAGYAANTSGVAPVGGWVGAGADDGIILAQGNRGSTPVTQATIRNVQVTTVPDGGVTLALLGGALTGLGVLRRKFRG